LLLRSAAPSVTMGTPVRLLLVALVATVLGGTFEACAAADAADDEDAAGSAASRAAIALAALQESWYNTSTGSWGGGKVDPDRGTVDSGMIGWWNAANTLEVIGLALQRLPAAGPDSVWAAGQREELLDQVIPSMYQLQNWTGCMDSRSYDDSGWVALAWIRAYEVTSEQRYLDRAMAFFAQVKREAWDDVCGGGLYWAGDKAGGGNRYKNAISNELFLVTAMRLHNHAPNASAAAQYLDWAQREWTWFRTSGMIIQNGSYVAGGLRNCSCDHAEGFTYNQGVILGGIGLLFEATPEDGESEQRAALIDAAEAIALGVVRSGSRWQDAETGVLLEPCEPHLEGCNADGTQFKGIFVRYLRYYLDSVCPVGGEDGCASPNADEYRSFLQRNADSVWSAARSEEDNHIGVHWSGPPPRSAHAANGAIAQTSGIDALLSVV